MRILIAFPLETSARQLAWELESFREDWRCSWVTHGGEALLAAPDHQVLILDSVLPGMGGCEVLNALQGRPAPPFTLLVGTEDSLADECFRRGAADYAAAIDRITKGLPRLYDSARGTACARYFLNILGFDSRLKGSRYLGWMLAAVLGNPALLGHLTDCLYPGAAQRANSTPGAVERCARHAIETLWSRGDLNILEQYFGQSVDPEKGKPTTREFLAMGLEHCMRHYAVWGAESVPSQRAGEALSEPGASS